MIETTVIFDRDGVVISAFYGHKELNPDTGKLEAVSAPEQPDEYGRVKISSEEIPDNPGSVDDVDNPTEVLPA